MKARAWVVIGLALVCSACAAPSLRTKKEVNRLMAQGNFSQAAGRLEQEKKSFYSSKDAVLFYLDQALLFHNAQLPQESDRMFSIAQSLIDQLYAKSISGAVGTLALNDLTAPYYVPPFENALTFFFRAMNFLQQNNLQGALVEARKAVFYLDYLRGSKRDGYNDDAFVQYFASLVFESGAKRDDARISRYNALKAYDKNGWNAPDFPVPADAAKKGEILIFHYNGLLPLMINQTMQVSWNRLSFLASSAREGEALSPEVQNALLAGWVGNAVTLAVPALQAQPYGIRSSFVTADGVFAQNTQLVQDVSFLARQELEEAMPGILVRSAVRAVVKQVAAVQARHAVAEAAQEDWVGDLAGRAISILGAVTEKADTRQWFTLPAEIRLARIFVPPGTHRITLFYRDGYGNIVGEHNFGAVSVKAGERVFLHHRTAQ